MRSCVQGCSYFLPHSLILQGSGKNLALSSSFFLSFFPSRPLSPALIGKHSLFFLSLTITLDWWKSNPGPSWVSSPKCHKKRNRGCVGSEVELSKEFRFFSCRTCSLYSLWCVIRERLTYINKQAYKKSMASHQWCNKKATKGICVREKLFVRQH